MYNDLINNRTYNVKTARLFGINAAVYWSAISEISLHVVRKKTYDEAGYFLLDRDYVETVTGLNVENQTICDKILEQVGLLQVSKEDPNRIGIHQKEWVALITEDDPDTLDRVAKQAASKKGGKAEGKKAGYKKNCNLAVVSIYPEEIQAMERLIDVLVEAGKLFRKDQIQLFQKTLDAYSKDLYARLKIIEECTTNAWVNPSWAIDKFRKSSGSRVSAPAASAPQKVATSFSSDTF